MITDPRKVLSILLRDPAERLILTLGEGWRLKRHLKEVAPGAVADLRDGGAVQEPYPGRLVPCGDSLFGDAQSWAWQPNTQMH